MAIHYKDSLAEILQYDIHDNRIESFAWMVATQLNRNLMESTPSHPTHRDEIASAFNASRTSIEKIRFSLATRMIPASNLQWLDDTIRQTTWIHRHVKESFVRSSAGFIQGEGPRDYFGSVLVPVHLLGRNRSIALIDYYSLHASVSLNDAISSLRQLEQKWIGNLKEDTYFDWVNKESTEEIIAYFWRWISEKLPQQTFFFEFPKNPDQLFCNLDQLNLTIQEKELYGAKARRAWTQLESRKNSKDKKQCNFWLSTKSIEKLERLSKQHDLSRTELIELLIESESRNPLHINARLQRRKNLIDPTE